MFNSWKARAAVLAVVATMAVPVLAIASPAGAAKGGNSAVAHACQKGGWMTLFRADGTAFANQDACVSYGAQGGTPQPKPAQQIACESMGGTFGATNEVQNISFSTVYFSCNNVPTADENAVYTTLQPICDAENPGAAAAAQNSGGGSSGVAPSFFTCGVLS